MAIPLGRPGDSCSSKAFRWQFKRNLAYIPAPLIYNGVFYMIRTGGIITSLQPSSGAILKQGRTEKAPGEYYASPVAADGKIFVASEEGKLSVLKASAQWEVLAVNDLGGRNLCHPGDQRRPDLRSYARRDLLLRGRERSLPQ